jgi:hypothetical protein
MSPIKASEVFAIPATAMVQAHADVDVSNPQVWSAIRELARTGHSALDIEVTCPSLWAGRRTVVGG